jgi:hypothetical protein
LFGVIYRVESHGTGGSMTNPYAAKARAWQHGFNVGYAEPEIEHLWSVTEDLEPAYREGELAGREARTQTQMNLPVQAAKVPSLLALRDAGDFDTYLVGLGVDPREPSGERGAEEEPSGNGGGFEQYSDPPAPGSEDPLGTPEEPAPESEEGIGSPEEQTTEPRGDDTPPDREDDEPSNDEEQNR